MRVLVTGGAGFIGGHLCEALLAAGHTVAALDNLTTGTPTNLPPAVPLVHGDVADLGALDAALDALHGPADAVLHLAGQASIRLSFSDPAADLHTNTLGTVRVLQACMERGVRRLLFASSMTVYGDPAQVPTPEDAPIQPASYYGVTKYAAERYVHLTAARTDMAAPLHVTSFRMFNVYGVRQSLANAYQGVFAIFAGRVLRGEPLHIHSDGAQTRDFVHISDVTRAWLAALDAPRSHGQVINLGTGVPVSVNQVADVVLAHFGHTRASYPISYGTAQPGDLRRSAADVTRANDLLGWVPQVRFEDGMAATLDWARTVLGA